MTVRCVECQRLSLRENPAMAAHGFGHCSLKPKHASTSATYPHKCDHFNPATPDAVAARIAWLEKRRDNRAIPAS